MPVDVFSPSALDHVVAIDEFGTYYFDDGSYHTYTNDEYPWTYSRLQAEIPAQLPQEVKTELAGTFPQGYGGGPLYGPNNIVIPSLTVQEINELSQQQQLEVLRKRAEQYVSQYPNATIIAPGGAVIQQQQQQTTGQVTVMDSTTQRVENIDNSLKAAMLAASGGNGYYTFDEWNWFYKQVSGLDGPAPEDVGLSRNSLGAVLIAGQERVLWETWASYASKQIPQIESKPPSQTGEYDITVAQYSIKELLIYLIKIIISGGLAKRPISIT